jgi:hypothetical protein
MGPKKLTSPTAIANCFFSGLASSTSFATLEYPVSPVVWAPLSEVSDVRRDKMPVEGAGEGAVVVGVVVAVFGFGVDREGTEEELCRRLDIPPIEHSNFMRHGGRFVDDVGLRYERRKRA